MRRLLNRIILYLFNKGFFNRMPDKLYIKIKYRIKMGKKLNLDMPTTFNEKLQWLKLYDRQSRYCAMADKLRAKEYASKAVGEKYIIPTLGVWKSFDEIDFSKLPDRFVLKCNHDSGNVFVCGNKEQFDHAKAKKTVRSSLSRNYYYTSREWVYKDIEPRVFAEELLKDPEGELADYKLFCFNGKVRTILVCQNRHGDCAFTQDFYSREWKHLDIRRPNVQNSPELIEKPEKLDELIEIAEKLSEGVPFLRVDMYICSGSLFFGEMTFYPAAGFNSFEPEETDYTFGEYLTLPNEQRKA